VKTETITWKQKITIFPSIHLVRANTILLKKREMAKHFFSNSCMQAEEGSFALKVLVTYISTNNIIRLVGLLVIFVHGKCLKTRNLEL